MAVYDSLIALQVPKGRGNFKGNPVAFSAKLAVSHVLELFSNIYLVTWKCQGWISNIKSKLKVFTSLSPVSQRMLPLPACTLLAFASVFCSCEIECMKLYKKLLDCDGTSFTSIKGRGVGWYLLLLVG